MAEARRVRPVELFEGGVSNAEIAGAVGVCAESVRRWRRVWEQGGASALWRRTASGRPPKLDDTQVDMVRAADLLFEVHAWIGVLDAFTHVSTRESRMAGVPVSLVALLGAEACNISLSPDTNPDIEVLTAAGSPTWTRTTCAATLRPTPC